MSADDWEDVAAGPSANDGWEDVAVGAPSASPAPQIAPQDTRPSWGQSAKFIGKSAVEGVTDLAGLVADYNPLGGMPGIASLFTKKDSPSALINKAKESIIGSSDDVGVTGVVPDVARAAMKAAVIPVGGPVVNAVSGAGSEIAHKLFPDSLVAPFVGGLAGPASAGMSASLAAGLKNTGQAFERASIGAGMKDYLKSQKIAGLLTDEEGDPATKLKLAINKIGDTEGWGVNRTPESLVAKNNAALKTHGAEIDRLLTEADSTGVAPRLDLESAGSATQKVIDNAKLDKAELVAVRDDILGRLTDPKNGWDGSISGLNSWKSEINNIAYSKSAQGGLTPAREALVKRAITSDMRDSILKGIGKSGVATEEEAAQAFAKYGMRKEVAPVLREALVKGESGTLASGLRGAIRTTGGFLTTPTLIGGAVGSTVGGPIGLAAGAALGALGTASGAGLAGSGLKAAARGINALRGGATALNSLPAAGASAISEVFSRKDPEHPHSAKSMSTPDKLRSPKLFDVSLKDALNTKVDKSSGISNVFTRGSAMPSTPEKVKLIEAKIDADPVDAAIYQMESGRNPNAKNPKSSAEGAFQLIKSTQKAFGVTDPTDIEQNYGAYKKLRAENEARFGDNPVITYAAHYLGAPVLSKYLKGAPLNTTEQAQIKEFEDKILPRFEQVLASQTGARSLA